MPTMTKGTKLAKFDFSKPSELTNASKATYPWDEWLDGDIWRIEEGTDFNTHPLMMERIIRTRATGRKARVQIKHLPKNGDGPFGVIVFQRTDITGPTAARKAEQSAKRAERRAAAQKDAEETLAKAGIKAKKAAPKVTPAKRAATPKSVAKPVKRVSKTPAKRPVKSVAA